MGALDGITVLDLAILVQGPQAAALLGGMGADVIKIELPTVGDLGRWLRTDPSQGAGAFFEGCNRDKRSVTLDLRQPGGKRALHKLVERADVLIHNFVPGTMEQWDLAYDTLAAINPRLIFASGSTFGPLGPDATREGADTLGQAAGGLISTTGRDGEAPTPVGAVVADHIGSLNMVAGILAALHHRHSSARGQKVEVSLLGGQIWAQASEYTHYLLYGEYGRSNNGHALLKGLLRMVPTADGYIQLVGVPQQMWPGFARCIGRDDLVDDPRFNTLLYAPADLVELCHIVDEIFPTRTTAEWCERLAAAGQRFSPVRAYPEVVADPGARANGYFVEVDHPERGRCLVVGHPIRMSETPTVAGVVAPELGQHTEEVLLEAGFSWEDLELLRAEGAW